ncbi:3-hydroxyacyl-CoA dehydrogenase family protein [Mycolicibacterium parafortuitum]|uniref:3-hydroxyacyl-CoA dehydrogenase [Saccharomonospora viridis DSM] n=1 Tax=Mycolicibacterium parafortuitum TaxID=39692 RepID=A0A375YDD4_MYCPF|nr:3-hydroxyacyl-CoA dehydrogenase family protein [Mycolicibacterium parafortuitum]ORB31088.1 3-hydroxyacyl-CoA dehydrogenase [Mycolicibacterium parafortuitum]PQD99425.1 3-hydroxyacyl-CoA dehydrogenase [Mycobacterium sp. EPG1]BBY74580.1 3-hydroxybutyryl-CoA dehydrogenase [Mycolicibacterium parafortuitum]SRX79123.1 3-hydroxyacyl-CoA dehydrogenase [Saccharomonospora viridis DSM] [Mycolicibacterium parafortuitum]
MRKINTVTVVGAGYMGGGIAQVFALNGFKVQIADVNADATREALKRLDKEAREFEEQGLFPEGSADTIMGNLTAGESLDEAVADVDFVMEAVFEDPDVKKEVLARVCANARPDTIIGTNTSTIPVKVLVEAVTNPERFLTVHFSNPAPFIPGVELVAGEATTQEVIDSVKDLLVRTGREGAQVADTPGMALNRLQYALLKEATLIVEQGVATKEDVDTIVRTTFGFRLGFFGPFAIADQAGLDVYVKGFRTLENEFGERMATPRLLTENVDAGRHGTKNGKGWTGDFDDATKAELIAYRNKAYSRMGELLRELGPAPKGS